MGGVGGWVVGWVGRVGGRRVVGRAVGGWWGGWLVGGPFFDKSWEWPEVFANCHYHGHCLVCLSEATPFRV